MTVWELWLTAAAQHHERTSYYILVVQEKKLQCMVSTEWVLFVHYNEVGSPKLAFVSWEHVYIHMDA
jgi:hypothetical protein